MLADWRTGLAGRIIRCRRGLADKISENFFLALPGGDD
jgi:hypothetical protein